MNDSTLAQWLLQQASHPRFTRYAVSEAMYAGAFTSDVLKASEDDLSKIYSVGGSKYAKSFGNFSRPIVDTYAQMACMEAIDLQVVAPSMVEIDDGLDKEIQQAETFLYNIYRNSNMLHSNMLKAFRMQAKKGDCFLQLSLTPPFDYKINILRPDDVFPLYADGNMDELAAAGVFYYRYSEDTTQHFYMQWYTPQTIQIYDLGTVEPLMSTWEVLTSNSIFDRLTSMVLQETMVNPLGIVPIVQVKNTSDDSIWCPNDLQSVLDVQRDINKFLTDLKIAAAYQVFKFRLVTGAMKSDVQAISTGPADLMSIGNSDAKLFESDPIDFTGFERVWDMLLDNVCAISGLPKQAFNKIEGAMPQTGVAIKRYYFAAHVRISEKRSLMAEALRKLNKMMLNHASGKAPNSSSWGILDSDIIWPSDLPEDELTRAQVHQMYLQMNAISRKTVMEEAGIESPEREFDQMLQEKTQLGDILLQQQKPVGVNSAADGGENSVKDENSTPTKPRGVS